MPKVNSRPQKDPRARAALDEFGAGTWADYGLIAGAFAVTFGLRGQDAEDVACSAVTKILSGERQWDTKKYPEFTQFLYWVVKGLASNLRQSAAQKTVVNVTEEKWKQLESNQRVGPWMAEAPDAHERFRREAATVKPKRSLDKKVYMLKLRGWRNLAIAKYLRVAPSTITACIERIRTATSRSSRASSRASNPSQPRAER